MSVCALNISNSVYFVFAGSVYGCIALVLFLALFFGLRARRNVKNERVTALPNGLSPLDVQRIFIGKTYPQRITKALLAHWAKLGYVKLKYIDKNHVRVIKLKNMPPHTAKGAPFFDRGTYVREHRIFSRFTNRSDVCSGKPISLSKPLITRGEAARINDEFAVREDEGVFSSKHYSLKIVTMALSILPFAFCAVWIGLSAGNFISLLLVGTAIIGLFVFKFAQGMPIPFKLIWCGIWLGVSVGGMIMFDKAAYDPYGLIYAAIAAMFGGSLIVIRFVDYREKNNLADYSDLVNYRKYLLCAPESELKTLDYITVLPYLYAFGIKFRVCKKFDRELPPDVYEGDPEKQGALL